MLTHERLKELLRYEPETGLFYWKTLTSNRVKVGSVAGYLQFTGYIYIRIDNKYHRAHRLAWFYTYGEWPENFIDHINGVRTDNRISNLRDVTKSVNSQNLRSSRRDNKLGFLGVNQVKNRFRAGIFVNGKRKHLGYYDTAEEAYAAYLAAKRRYHVGNTL